MKKTLVCTIDYSNDKDNMQALIKEMCFNTPNQSIIDRALPNFNELNISLIKIYSEELPMVQAEITSGLRVLSSYEPMLTTSFQNIKAMNALRKIFENDKLSIKYEGQDFGFKDVLNTVYLNEFKKLKPFSREQTDALFSFLAKTSYMNDEELSKLKEEMPYLRQIANDNAVKCKVICEEEPIRYAGINFYNLSYLEEKGLISNDEPVTLKTSKILSELPNIATQYVHWLNARCMKGSDCNIPYPNINIAEFISGNANVFKTIFNRQKDGDLSLEF